MPKCGKCDWDVQKLTRQERETIRNGLVARMTHDENEYRMVLSYMHMKFPDLMDVHPGDGKRFQWRYHTFAEKVQAYDAIGHCKWDMYGLVYYDPARDMEPVAVGGSYLREAGAIRDPYTHKLLPGQEMNRHTSRIRCGHGYVLFVDPDYRRMGLARDQWVTEAQLYRDSGVCYQKENQTYDALQVTLSLFQDPDKVHVLNRRGGVNSALPGMVTKIIMDYRDDELIRLFDALPAGLHDFRSGLDFHFMERECLHSKDLLSPWDGVKTVGRGGYGDASVILNLSVNRDVYERFKRKCDMEGMSVKDALVMYMNWA